MEEKNSPAPDALDARILLALEHDADATVVALAQRLGVARNTVQARLRRLRESGVISDYSRRIVPEALGFGLTAFLAVSIRQGHDDVALAGITALPEVVEIHATTGDADLRVRVVARDTADLYRVTSELVKVPGIVRTSTAVALREILPLRVAPLLQRIAEGK